MNNFDPRSVPEVSGPPNRFPSNTQTFPISGFSPNAPPPPTNLQSAGQSQSISKQSMSLPIPPPPPGHDGPPPNFQYSGPPHGFHPKGSPQGFIQNRPPPGFHSSGMPQGLHVSGSLQRFNPSEPPPGFALNALTQASNYGGGPPQWPPSNVHPVPSSGFSPFNRPPIAAEPNMPDATMQKFNESIAPLRYPSGETTGFFTRPLTSRPIPPVPPRFFNNTGPQSSQLRPRIPLSSLSQEKILLSAAPSIESVDFQVPPPPLYTPVALEPFVHPFPPNGFNSPFSGSVNRPDSQIRNRFGSPGGGVSGVAREFSQFSVPHLTISTNIRPAGLLSDVNACVSSSILGDPPGGSQSVKELENMKHGKDSSVAKDIVAVRSRLGQSEDTDWVCAWAIKRGLTAGKSSVDERPRRTAEQETLTLGCFRKLLVEAVNLSSQLKSMSSADSTCLPPSEDVMLIRNRLKQIRQLVDNEQVVKKIQERLNMASKKRLRLKRKRQELYEKEQERLANQQRVEQELAQWKTDMARREFDIKKEKEMKTAADAILAEVRRKLTEARRAVKLLAQLRRLRDVRRDKALRREVRVPEESDAAFEERVGALTQTMQRQISMYEAEEQTLEVMLDMEREEDLVRERIARRRKEDERLRAHEQRLRTTLFGADEMPLPSDPLYPYRQFYDVGLHSLAAFVRIRQDWDMYAIPGHSKGGSSVPFGWVEPVEPSSHVWASALESNLTG